MSIEIFSGLDQGLLWIGENTSPALPSAGLIRIALPLGWGIVLAAALAWAFEWQLKRRHAGSFMSSGRKAGSSRSTWLAIGIALVGVVLPEPLSPAYWLGLAFQMPSLTLIFLCGAALIDHLTGRGFAGERNNVSKFGPPAARWHGVDRAMTLAGVLLGWVLLLDTFALLPVSVYPWGFGSSALVAMSLVAVLPWLLAGHRDALFLPLVVAVFVALRLPTGNLWDALMDPWLWLLLHWRLMRPAK